METKVKRIKIWVRGVLKCFSNSSQGRTFSDFQQPRNLTCARPLLHETLLAVLSMDWARSPPPPPNKQAVKNHPERRSSSSQLSQRLLLFLLLLLKTKPSRQLNNPVSNRLQYRNLAASFAINRHPVVHYSLQCFHWFFYLHLQPIKFSDRCKLGWDSEQTCWPTHLQLILQILPFCIRGPVFSLHWRASLYVTWPICIITLSNLVLADIHHRM